MAEGKGDRAQVVRRCGLLNRLDVVRQTDGMLAGDQQRVAGDEFELYFAPRGGGEQHRIVDPLDQCESIDLDLFASVGVGHWMALRIETGYTRQQLSDPFAGVLAPHQRLPTGFRLAAVGNPGQDRAIAVGGQERVDGPRGLGGIARRPRLFGPQHRQAQIDRDMVLGAGLPGLRQFLLEPAPVEDDRCPP